jgi:hypothetical protein
VRYRSGMRRLCLLLVLLLATGPVSAVQKGQAPDTSYSGSGPGHFIRTISEDGQYITLEDRSNWQVDPRSRFKTREWQPDEGITVRQTKPEDGYAYFLDNVDKDDGTLARYLPR